MSKSVTGASIAGARHAGGGLAAWLEHHGWSLIASLRRLAHRPVGSLLTITVMGLALALPLVFYLLLFNVQQLGHSLGQNQGVDVFMQPGLGANSAQALATQLQRRPDVASVTLTTPQQGLDELAKEKGFSGAVNELDANPLPYRLRVLPRDALSAAVVDHLVHDLRGIGGVDLVRDGGSWRQRLDAFLDLGRQVVLGWSLLLAFAALLVVSNTVRVDILGRTEEIGVLLLLGASPRFVRRPYLYGGVWYGLIGGGWAIGVTLLVEYSLKDSADTLSQAYDQQLQFQGLPWSVLLAVPLTAALLGWCGARVISGWQLRRLGLRALP